MIFGERLKAARAIAQLTQQQLADAVGMTKASISGLELGTSKKPSAENLLPLAKALHVHAQWLISGKGERYDLSPVQRRISEAMASAGMQAFDLAEATGGLLSPQSVDIWLTGRGEPDDAQLQMIAGPLRKSAAWLRHGIDVAHENNVRIVYDARGEPLPENLNQFEIDIVRALRDMDQGDREAVRTVIMPLAEAARAKQKKDTACA